eukprot:3231260-Pleurochrysis_carterae.AAC.1
MTQIQTVSSGLALLAFTLHTSKLDGTPSVAASWGRLVAGLWQQKAGDTERGVRAFYVRTTRCESISYCLVDFSFGIS